jgi:hypothetical protein
VHHLQLGVQARHGLVAQRNATPYKSPPPTPKQIASMHNAKMSEERKRSRCDC